MPRQRGKDMNNHCQKFIIASSQDDNNTEMVEQNEEMKSGENESKGPSKTLASEAKFWYRSLVSNATTPLPPPYPDHPR